MLAWPFLVVIDLDEVTVRCRACRWVSPTLSTVPAARLAYATHDCAGSTLRGPLLGWCAVCGRPGRLGHGPGSTPGSAPPAAWAEP
jgi:hypothetical protein